MSTELLNPQDLSFDTRPADLPPQMRLIAQLLRKLQHGALRIDYPNGDTETYGNGHQSVTLMLRDWRVASAALKSGDIGFAESYIAGHWQTDDLPRLLELFARNRQAVESVIYGSWWGGLLHRIRHLLNRNSKSGSRKNIHAHYDIGNAFYQLWLDPSMTYSSALFSDAQQSLQDAQDAKYRRILGELQLKPGARVLEIGCGWGGLAELAGREAGAHVTGLTLSTEQLLYAQARLKRAGLGAQADLRLQDYRDMNGQFDGIASIEMFEAVGEPYWPSYFACLARNLRAGGRACIQTITIDDVLFERYRKGTDFIQQYIFPGGMLPSPSVFQQHAEKHGLRLVQSLAFGQDYARTLAEWRHVFKERGAQVAAQGFDERFQRTWEFYLAYCEAGFRARNIDVMQFTLEKL